MVGPMAAMRSLGLQPEFHLKLANGFGDDALEGAAPAGVNGGDHLLLWIDDEDGGAVGGADTEKQAGILVARRRLCIVWREVDRGCG